MHYGKYVPRLPREYRRNVLDDKDVGQQAEPQQTQGGGPGQAGVPR